MSSFVGQPVGFENDSREDEFTLCVTPSGLEARIDRAHDTQRLGLTLAASASFRRYASR